MILFNHLLMIPIQLVMQAVYTQAYYQGIIRSKSPMKTAVLIKNYTPLKMLKILPLLAQKQMRFVLVMPTEQQPLMYLV